ncbi:Protein fam43a [Mactra antiquata]
MFNRLKDRAKITDQDPKFKARYIGNMETFTASGRGCTTSGVQKLWDNSEEEHFLKRVQLKITTAGIHMKNLDNKKEQELLFNIENISFCNVDTIVNSRIFSWIARSDADKTLQLHAVICKSSETAKALSIVLSRAFQMAYKDWKSSRSKTLRENEKYKRSKSMPAPTLSKQPEVKPALSKQYSMDNDTHVNNNICEHCNETRLSQGSGDSMTAF